MQARIVAHLRREKRKGTNSKIQVYSDFIINYTSRTFYYKNEIVAFTKTEYEIIELFCTYPEQIFTKNLIYRF